MAVHFKGPLRGDVIVVFKAFIVFAGLRILLLVMVGRREFDPGDKEG